MKNVRRFGRQTGTQTLFVPLKEDVLRHRAVCLLPGVGRTQAADATIGMRCCCRFRKWCSPVRITATSRRLEPLPRGVGTCCRINAPRRGDCSRHGSSNTGNAALAVRRVSTTMGCKIPSVEHGSSAAHGVRRRRACSVKPSPLRLLISWQTACLLSRGSGSAPPGGKRGAGTVPAGPNVQVPPPARARGRGMGNRVKFTRCALCLMKLAERTCFR